jgi:rSAM/selenodomain-associated transferase 2
MATCETCPIASSIGDGRLKVSVIIPTLNEASCVGHTLEQITHDRPDEIIVADGGSTDSTARIAAQWARVIETHKGRAVQQNAAARAASGDILLFLHADCRPEPGWKRALSRTMERRRCVAGCFQMRIDRDGVCYRAIERGGDLRVRWLALPYGDQGIFVRRDAFWKLGGFPVVPLMEDLLFMRRLRKLGSVQLAPHAIRVSARRWERTGVLRQTVRNWTLTALAIGMGVHPERLAKFYPAVR